MKHTRDANEIINKAFKFHSKGNISAAKKFYKYCIDQGLNDPKIFSNYGVILQGQGKLHEAEASYRRAIELNPNYATAYSNLGGILQDLGKLKEAEISTRKAIELNPNYATAYSNLGGILQDLGKLKEAEISTRRAIKFNPDFSNAHLNLGSILQDLRKLKEAEISTRRAIKFNPNNTMAHSNLGSILKDLGKLKEAEISTRRAIKLNPDFSNAHLNLGSILQDLGKLKEAEISTRKAIQVEPNNTMAYSNLGGILKDLGKLKEAESYTRKAIQFNPNYAEAYFNLFLHYEEINNLEKLKESLEEFKKIDSIENERILFHARLSFRNKKHQIAKELIDNISPEWIEKSNKNQKIIYWNFKGFINDKLGNYDIAYSCFQQSQNNTSFNRFSKDSYLNYINTYKESINHKKKILTKINDEIKDSNLAFLIGFPRSGTTLLDTILRSHKDIEVIEEKPLIETIEKLVKEKFNTKLDNLYNISEENIFILRKQYCELLWEYKTKNSHLTIDKLPLNTVSLPLINLIFPNAKIIFTHRHPYDTVLSCFQQLFSSNSAMMHLTSLKSSSKIYDQVMNAWDIYRNNLPLDFITSKYENLIENFDSHILQILEFLGVTWDENVKNYRKTAIERERINTPSSSQVVQPLYKSSINKWKNYEKYFENCHQYLERWVLYFDY